MTYFTGSSAMHKQHFICLFYLILFLLLTLNFGCSSKKIIIKKKVMVLPPIDLSGLPAGKAAWASKKLVDILKESPHLLIYPPPVDMSLPQEIKAPKYGVTYYDPNIANMAKDLNMNAIMSLLFPPIENIQGRAGIWPFRYDTEVYKISMITNVMDVTNGCLYLTHLNSEQIAFPLDEVDSLTEKEIFSQAITKALPKILKHQSSTLINKLSNTPWSGKILEMNERVLIINGGKDVGIYPDQLFTVYTKGKKVLCQTGRTVEMLGEKTGRIKTISVKEDYSLVKPESGGPFLSGQTVIFR